MVLIIFQLIVLQLKFLLLFCGYFYLAGFPCRRWDVCAGHAGDAHMSLTFLKMTKNFLFLVDFCTFLPSFCPVLPFAEKSHSSSCPRKCSASICYICMGKLLKNIPWKLWKIFHEVVKLLRTLAYLLAMICSKFLKALSKIQTKKNSSGSA